MRKEGLADWKKMSGYHRRSLAETAMYQFKQLMTGKISLRTYNGQVGEVMAYDWCNQQTEHPWSACQKAPSVAVTWGWGRCDLMADLGNNAI
jgi:hypothetical protein